MFKQEFHQKIYTVLQCLNPELFVASYSYFGGGTLISLLHGEHRLSKDIDFICPIASGGYRLLRQEIGSKGYRAIFTNFERISLPTDIQANQYGVRFPLLVDGTRIKLEIIAEARIQLGTPEYPSWSPVPCLNQTDCFAEKLLSNSDRWIDASVESRDLIDLSVQRLAAAIPAEAIDKAESAYPVIEPLTRAIQYFQDHPDYRDKCFKSLKVDAKDLIIDGLDLLATDFGMDITTRTFSETNWEYLGYEEQPYDVILDQAEAQATARAIQEMLLHIGEPKSDGSVSFESKNFLFEQRDNIITITALQDNREVLRVEGDRVIAFNPTESERKRLQYLREQVENDFQQQNPQQQQPERGRGRSR